ncbi:MAG: hypothetical protein F6K41_08180 [Symploca sp. SIO3E6]|nr:hypothetical protein [Caldora sp. SIO3E6]
MKLKSISIISGLFVLGLTTISGSVIGLQATGINNDTSNHLTDVAQVIYPEGYFKNNEWGVRLEYKNGTFNYFGENLKTGNNLALTGCHVSGSRRRYTYTFINQDYQYIIAHRPNDPNLVRLKVIDPNGRTILNRLMDKVGNDYDV